MDEKKEVRISDREIKMGEEMSTITFGELVQELTGCPFEEVYKDYLKHGVQHESIME